MRFSLRWLFGGVAYVAIACASLVYASEPISKTLGAALFAFLMIAVLGAIFACRNHRRFWAGCAIVGLTYYATFHVAQYPNAIQLPRATTREVLDWLHQKLVRNINDRATARGFIVRPSDLPQKDPFHAAGHSLTTFAWAIAGGIVAGRFRRDEPKG